MKRLLPWLPALLCVLLVTSPILFAATSSAAQKPAAESSRVGAELASTLSQVTGVAISPLLGVSALGAFKWFKATEAEREHLPWYCGPQYWSIGLLIVAAVAFKDASGAALPPGWKKPLDIAETLENKLSGLVAVGAFIPFTIDTLSTLLTQPGGAHAALPSGLAMLPLAAIDWSWLLNILLVPFAVALFGVVWLASHAINVLILISPWGAVDAALKSARLAVLGLVTLSAQLDPWIAITCSLVVVLVSYLIAGWSFRLSVFGWIFCWDSLTFRRTRFTPEAKENWVFSGDRIEGVPIRTYGRVMQGEDGKLVLKYRPWLFLPQKQATLPDAKLAVGRGAFYPTLEGTIGEDEITLLTLPPRYMTHEERFARAYGIGELTDVGLRRAWGVIKELFGFENQRRQKVA